MHVLALSSAAHPPPPTGSLQSPTTSLQSPAAPTLLAQLAPELRFQIAIELGALGAPPPRTTAAAAAAAGTAPPPPPPGQPEP